MAHDKQTRKTVAEQSKRTYAPGVRVFDKEQGGAHDPLYVVALTNTEAQHYYFGGLDGEKSVYHANLAYPKEAEVVICAFADALDAVPEWEDHHPDQLAYIAGKERIATYSYPIDRLTVADPREQATLADEEVETFAGVCVECDAEHVARPGDVCMCGGEIRREKANSEVGA